MTLRPAMLLFSAVLAVTVAAVWWFTMAPRGDTAPILADPTNAALVALGARVYDEACASCHGKNLEGEPNWRTRKPDGRFPAPPHDTSGHTWHHDDATLFGITRLGPGGYAGTDYPSDMPGFADMLSDREIWAVLAYIKSTWPAEIRARQAQINRQAGGR